MFCPKCGKPVKDEDDYCPYCGHKLEKRDGSFTSNEEEHPYTNYNNNDGGFYDTNKNKDSKVYNSNGNKGSELAVVGFILSFFVPIAGLIVSLISLVKMPKDESNSRNRKFAIAGLIISILGILLNIYWISLYYSSYVNGDSSVTALLMLL